MNRLGDLIECLKNACNYKITESTMTNMRIAAVAWRQSLVSCGMSLDELPRIDLSLGRAGSVLLRFYRGNVEVSANDVANMLDKHEQIKEQQ